MYIAKRTVPPPTLNTLPSELRRIIVAHLAPSGPNHVRYAPGSKVHLKNANLAHSCLREWVPEYMFQEMCLTHVVVGISSHLELFALDPSNTELMKHVKVIHVKVPPAIRWEVHTDDPFDSLSDITDQRLAKSMKVVGFDKLAPGIVEYFLNYHKALVEPFTSNNRWYALKSASRDMWYQTFRRFPNLEHISVGICKRNEHPSPTYTNTFVSQYGKDVIMNEEPMFVEDCTTNLAWASSSSLLRFPETVKSLHLHMANLDNLNTFATVNRLLNTCYGDPMVPTVRPHLAQITKLVLDIQGAEGVHGRASWPRNTGSAGAVRYWKKVLTCMKNLTHLDIRQIAASNDVTFTDNEQTDLKSSILQWLLPDWTHLEGLRHLALRYFKIDRDSISKILSSEMSQLTSLCLSEISLTWDEEDGYTNWGPQHLDHLQGQTWITTCQWLSTNLNLENIEIVRPLSNINTGNSYIMHPKVFDQVRAIPNVTLDTSGSLRRVVGFAPRETMPKDPVPPLEDSYILELPAVPQNDLASVVQ
ncbi:hypothetical protein P154DRAFT_620263 [Amniculicola lignicola CBS 123094]|uniref:Uncharacterized protein n=1 Tax=Amniculicola lignicola CBS 123094 TaxID=1392246 RepID=A0A6A5WSE5_9PLEO|nr:hypothetical protein P154DRAFT_620263 [Amniculicola lignicola CBS 123094]